ncbi:MAG: hypothetical protein HY958_14735 [Bacteroidia bacterium]|nr:hypothetical protein [Bacteroidia bacterium]
MKRTVLLFLLIVAGLTMLFSDSFGQSPQLINYQAVASNTGGQLIANQNISVRISILSGSPTGTTEYSETHAVTTNQFGIFTIQIGGGTVVSGIFYTINWSNANHYVKVEADETGGANYQLLGTSQLVSVPYALYAENAGNVSSGDFVKIQEQTLVSNQDLVTFSIPTGYKFLKIVIYGMGTSSTSDALGLRINNLSNSNYSMSYIDANGVTITGGTITGNSSWQITQAYSTYLNITEILLNSNNPFSSSTQVMFLSKSSQDGSDSRDARGYYNGTSLTDITQIDISSRNFAGTGSQFSQNSRFILYGMK